MQLKLHLSVASIDSQQSSTWIPLEEKPFEDFKVEAGSHLVLATAHKNIVPLTT